MPVTKRGKFNDTKQNFIKKVNTPVFKNVPHCSDRLTKIIYLYVKECLSHYQPSSALQTAAEALLVVP